jgi:hypothetical protein
MRFSLLLLSAWDGIKPEENTFIQPPKEKAKRANDSGYETTLCSREIIKMYE